MSKLEKLPVYPKFIACLLLPTSLLRIFIGTTVVLTLFDGADSRVPTALTWVEGISGFLAGWIGFSAGARLLKKQSKSIKQGWLSVLFNVINIVVSFIGFQIVYMDMPMDPPVFDVYGMGLVRVAFTAAYVLALIQAAKWFRSQASQNSANQSP